MSPVDLASWDRREHYELFRSFGIPRFNVTVPVEIGDLRSAVKTSGTTLTVALTYALAQAANRVASFRLRIHGDQVVSHDVVHPAITVLADNDIFGFCFMEYHEDFHRFAAEASLRIAETRRRPTLGKLDRDDLLFMTSIPWLSFTGFTHPMTGDPTDSVPRIAWGRITDSDDCWSMPLSVEGHHALIDGIHVARFFDQVRQSCLDLGSLLKGSAEASPDQGLEPHIIVG